jgi:hypothetical protein
MASQRKQSNVEGEANSVTASTQPATPPAGISESHFEDIENTLPDASTLVLYLGIGCLAIINVIFLVDIELTLKRSGGLRDDGEHDWGFGQVLALVLLVVLLTDFITSIASIWRQEERAHAEDQKRGAQVYLEEILPCVLKPDSDRSRLKPRLVSGPEAPRK